MAEETTIQRSMARANIFPSERFNGNTGVTELVVVFVIIPRD